MLLTDIEGSTHLARELGPGWRDVIDAHHRLVAGAITAEGGSVEATAGDSFFALFEAPDRALAAATAAQRAIAQHEWPRPMRIRMGVHTGVIERGDDQLIGLDIHLAARVEGAAHGGQVLVTEATRALVRQDFKLESVGEHRLKDFPAPEPLWQLVHDGRGPDAFPPLRTEPVRPTNLPADPRRLVGRKAELETLRDLLTGPERLVTVVGPSGAGKTRLAIAVAESLLSHFAGGVWLVQLAGIRDGEKLLATIGHAIGVPDREARSVVRRLRARPALVVLDNFEHMVATAPAVAELLEEATGTRVLVTSQLPLRVARERVVRLQPLPAADAYALFVRRAAAAAPDFDVDANHETIEAICVRLEGLPLAVELAAARVATLAPADLLKRLDRSLGVLVRGPRDLPMRHRTLRDALAWTYDLLEPAERRLYARLAAFAGPAPLDAIEAVAGVEAIDALDGLIDASLARRAEHREHGVRYSMPQAVRDFAAEQLAASSEEHAVRSAHALHLAELAEAACFFLPGVPDALRAPVHALRAEQRPALDWTRINAPDVHARLASSLGFVLSHTGRTREAYVELGAVLERVGVDGLVGGWAAVVRAASAQNLELDDEGLMERGLAAVRAAGDPLRLQLALQAASLFAYYAGDAERAVELAEEALALARRDGHLGRLAGNLLLMGQVLVLAGRLTEAERYYDEAEPLVPRSGDSLLSFGQVRGDLALEQGDWQLAANCYLESVLTTGRHSTNQLILDLRLIALALARLGGAEATIELDAAAHAIGATTGEVGGNPWAQDLAEALLAARDDVGGERAEAAVMRGRVLSPAAAVTRAEELVQSLTARLVSRRSANA